MEFSTTDDGCSILWDVRMGLDDVKVMDPDIDDCRGREPTEYEWDMPLAIDPGCFRTLTISLHCNRGWPAVQKVVQMRDPDWTLYNVLSVVDDFYSTPIEGPGELLPIAEQDPGCGVLHEVVESFRAGGCPCWGDMIGSASWFEGFDVLAPNLIQLSCGT